ncbi:hypothetical protein [Anaerovorax sp. IOR16]|uniref:hypothetical protein n=1 Tax=Anaerovorax sp. IOR16 TaxID=2773458 RepID=UPI0019CFBC7F|nr:hypothetical protein [Anaerovorax sp. IOR16]
MEKLFFCYSNRLKRALISNGFTPICIGINKRNNQKFYLFEGTFELNYYKDYLYQKERDKF